MKNPFGVAWEKTSYATVNNNWNEETKYKLTLSKCLKHAHTVLNHKKEVLRLCIIAGIPLQGLVHDLSKFTPVEFIESAAFYQGDKTPIRVIKDTKGVCEAWLHHKGCNKHHWDYWVDNLSIGGTPNKMPYRYALEMACDIIAASKVYNGAKYKRSMPVEYFDGVIVNEHIHTDTVKFVHQVLQNYAKYGDSALYPARTKQVYV